jgi:hypothetical protein
LTEELKALFVETAEVLKGHERRRFVARTVQALGEGGQRRAERELGWRRLTIRKGLRELEHVFVCIDAKLLRRHKYAEEHLPRLLDDIRAIVDSQSQTDLHFRSARLYTRITAAEVRRQLISQNGYSYGELPTERIISTKLRLLGYYPRHVAKSQPQKRSPKPMTSSSS